MAEVQNKVEAMSMGLTRIRWGFILLAAILLLTAFGSSAEAGGRRGGRRVVLAPRVSAGLYGSFYGSYWGNPYLFPSHSPFLSGYYGFPYYGPYQEVRGGLNPALAQALDVGAVDLDVKPRKAEVFVDGAYVGTARDFDGSPSFLWLDAGEHAIVIYKGGYASYEEVFVIEPGIVTKVKLRMTAGASEPPGGEVGATSSPALYQPST